MSYRGHKWQCDLIKMYDISLFAVLLYGEILLSVLVFFVTDAIFTLLSATNTFQKYKSLSFAKGGFFVCLFLLKL